MRFLRFILLAVPFLFCLCSERKDRKSSDDSLSISSGDTVAAPVADIRQELWRLADSVVNELTLEQRIGQCFMPAIPSASDAYTIKKLKEYIVDHHVGGVVLLSGDLQSAALLSSLGRETLVPLFISIDAEWGLGMRLYDAPDFPKNGKISDEVDEILMFDYGREVARECQLTGINMVLGPVVDVIENTGGFIGSRSFGNNPERVAELGIAYAKGLESGGVISVAKHFPGHGSPSGDSHKTLPVINKSFNHLDSIDLLPFKNYIDEDLSGVMVGHLAVPDIDSTYAPAAMSRAIITDLLKERLKFNGLILTDAISMGGAQGYDSSDALKAGADIIVAPLKTGEEIKNVERLVRKGEISLEEINEKCRKIIFYKLLLGYGGSGPILLEGLAEEVALEAESLLRRFSGTSLSTY